jgi:hypothetical protein
MKGTLHPRQGAAISIRDVEFSGAVGVDSSPQNHVADATTAVAQLPQSAFPECRSSQALAWMEERKAELPDAPWATATGVF